jgi:hypothetical protein
MSRDTRRAVVASLLTLALVVGVLSGSYWMPGTDERVGGSPPARSAHGSADDAGSMSGLQSGPVLQNHSDAAAGSPVRVGIIGTEFDTRDSAFRTQVAEQRDFDRPTGRVTHGTAVAEVVSHTLPDSQLYLASVGSSPSTDSYAEAVDWLVQNDADVIVDAGSYFPRSTEAARQLASATRHATNNGVVFVTSAGNYRQRHWSGPGASDGWVAFDDQIQVNALAGGDQISGRVSLRLSWNSSADYDLYLYQFRRHGESVVVAKSTTRENGTGGAIEAIDASVPKGQYYVAVYAENGTDESDRVDLFAAHHDLEYATENGSVVSPVSMEGVIVVGAYDTANGSVAPYSSRGGPDGEVDLLAPELARTSAAGTLRGTSAAAPYVAGTAAVLRTHNESLSPAEVERILERTADGNRVDPAAAVRAVDTSVSSNETAA